MGLQPYAGTSVGSLYARRACRRALVLQQRGIAGNRKFYPVLAVKTAHAVGIDELRLKKIFFKLREDDCCRLAPRLGLIFKGDFVVECSRTSPDHVFPFLQHHIPVETLGGIVLRIAVTLALRLTVQEEFHLRLVGVHEDFLLLVGRSPAHGPRTAVDV